jgi:hypothetical protein
MCRWHCGRGTWANRASQEYEVRSQGLARRPGADNHGLDLPGGGLIILQRSDTPGRIDHFCVGVDNWDADRLRAAARVAGVERVIGNAADNFFAVDPDGLRVQVSAVDWSA